LEPNTSSRSYSSAITSRRNQTYKFLPIPCHRHRYPSTMSFHFASTEYAKCFQDLPIPDVGYLKKSAIDYLDNTFDEESWYNDPVRLAILLLDGIYS
jgi:hypothetical protein